MHRKRLKIHIGLRAVKTILSVLIAMMIVDAFGATTARMIFACRDCENNEANGSLHISGRLIFSSGKLKESLKDPALIFLYFYRNMIKKRIR